MLSVFAVVTCLVRSLYLRIYINAEVVAHPLSRRDVGRKMPDKSGIWYNARQMEKTLEMADPIWKRN